MKVISAVGADIGNLRENNEDNFYYNGIILSESDSGEVIVHSDIRNDKLQFYAICDGMGGEEQGEVASNIAVSTLKKYQQMMNEIKYHDFDKYIDMYLAETNTRICEVRHENNNCRIGTTIALIFIENETLHITNVGDSRIYQLKRNRLLQISEDHTSAMRAYKMGSIKKEEIKTHPHRNKLTQYLGLFPEEMTIQPFNLKLKAKNKDRFLICSDGLTDMVSEDDICKIIRKSSSPEEAVRHLVEKAKAGGGRDNITAMVLTVEKKLFAGGAQ